MTGLKNLWDETLSKRHARKSVALLMIVLAAILLLVGCKGKDKEPESVAGDQAINVYSSQNVFEETLRQVQANPEDVDALYHLADLYDRQGHYQQAVDTFGKVIELDPDRGYAYFKMGTAYSRMNKPQKAVEVLLQAAEHLPKNPVVYNNLGIAYRKLNRLDEAIAAFQKALEIRPRYAATRYNLGLTYHEKGDRENAMAQYEALNEFDATMAASLKKKIEAH